MHRLRRRACRQQYGAPHCAAAGGLAAPVLVDAVDVQRAANNFGGEVGAAEARDADL